LIETYRKLKRKGKARKVREKYNQKAKEALQTVYPDATIVYLYSNVKKDEIELVFEVVENSIVFFKSVILTMPEKGKVKFEFEGR